MTTLSTPSSKSIRSREQRELGIAIAFLLPNLLGFLLFTSGPVLFSLVVSFSNWNLQQTVPFRWVGIENYVTMLHNSEFWLYAINTFYFLLGMPISVFGSLLLAILLNQRLRGIVLFRTLFYLPSFTSGVALMILWKSLYNPDFGLINAAIRHISDLFHLVITPPEWLLSTKNVLGLDVEHVATTRAQWGLGARDAIIFMGIWMGIGGNNMLLYLAALTNVPPELTEAAEIDGANSLQTFRYIVWPQLAPTTFFILVMSFIGGLQGGFEQARVMTNGGPAGTTTTLSYHIYTKAFEEFQIGYASAVSWALFALIFVLTLINWRFGNREATY